MLGHLFKKRGMLVNIPIRNNCKFNRYCMMPLTLILLFSLSVRSLTAQPCTTEYLLEYTAQTYSVSISSLKVLDEGDLSISGHKFHFAKISGKNLSLVLYLDCLTGVIYDHKPLPGEVNPLLRKIAVPVLNQMNISLNVEIPIVVQLSDEATDVEIKSLEQLGLTVLSVSGKNVYGNATGYEILEIIEHPWVVFVYENVNYPYRIALEPDDSVYVEYAILIITVIIVAVSGGVFLWRKRK